MKIGIAGGTGGMGEGFALRWCQKHDVVVGSRDAQKAREAAENYTKTAKQTYGNNITGSISGNDNISLANDVDVLILSIPYEFIDETCGKLVSKVRDDCIVVSPIVPMARKEAGFVYIPLEEKGKQQAAEMVADRLPPRSRVVSAFHTISESKLKKIQQTLDADTFICGDDQNAIAKLTNLIDEISGLRPVYLGPLALTYQAEILTPMCLNAAKRNKMKNPGVKLV
ncbi:MAG: NADPH-dependent F420 reductase [Thermoproteota archaeon]|jgi:8-hydroxy-5-deazaflavin:NADPH oxidoreductase|nr:NADPH-dependent F420 reductase [Thermoproteota archaeon]